MNQTQTQATIPSNLLDARIVVVGCGRYGDPVVQLLAEMAIQRLQDEKDSRLLIVTDRTSLDGELLFSGFEDVSERITVSDKVYYVRSGPPSVKLSEAAALVKSAEPCRDLYVVLQDPPVDDDWNPVDPRSAHDELLKMGRCQKLHLVVNGYRSPDGCATVVSPVG